MGAILLPRILVLCYNCNMQQMQHATNAGEPNESPRQHILTDQTVPANDNPSAEATAAVVLDVVPLVMRTIRMRMREARAADLSVPQFRALAHLKKHPGVSLSDVAEYVGLTLPAASRMMDGLVARGYAERRLSAISRRSIELRLSAKGLEMLDVTLQHTRQALAELLAPLSEAQQATVTQALETLRLIFSTVPEASRAENLVEMAGQAADTAEMVEVTEVTEVAETLKQ